MKSQATAVVAKGALGAKLITHRSVEMRYQGQGHEISIPLPDKKLNAKDVAKLRARFEARYEEQFGLRVAGVPVEFLTWSVNVSTLPRGVSLEKRRTKTRSTAAKSKTRVFDPASGKQENVAVFRRADLRPGVSFAGPAIVVEPQTSTLLPKGWRCRVTPHGHLLLERNP